MAMIALAPFIVVADESAAAAAVKQAVFEAMGGWRHWRGEAPNHDFQDHAIVEDDLIVKYLLGFHMAYDAINQLWRQTP